MLFLSEFDNQGVHELRWMLDYKLMFIKLTLIFFII